MVDQQISNPIRRAAGETGMVLRFVHQFTQPPSSASARSGWTASLDSPFMGEPDYTAGSRGSTAAEAIQINEGNIRSTADAYTFGRKLFIRNNVPYIVILEEGGSPRQAPGGMMSFAIDAALQEMK